MTTPPESLTGARHNVKGILLMVGAMALFAIEDALLKAATSDLSTGQIILINCGASGVIFAAMAIMRRESLISRAVWTGMPLLRSLSEVAATAFYVTSLALIPLSMASAILQSTPIMITMLAAIFLGERVGWRRWTAIILGLVGVLIILRPGLDGFRPEALWGVAGAIALSLREIFTRRIPQSLTALQVGFGAMVGVAAVGAAMMLAQGGWQNPTGAEALILTGIVATGALGYVAVIEAARIGEIAVVTPFRYVRLPAAILLGAVFFSEWPDALTMLGSALVIGTGLYTLWRERKTRLAARSHDG